MERINPVKSEEFYKSQIRDTVEFYYPILTHYILDTNNNFPNCCKYASNNFRALVKRETGITLDLCEGKVKNLQKGSFCDYHVWLEYNGLIIDTTDYQFEAMDFDLPITIENFFDESIGLNEYENITSDQIKEKMWDTYCSKNKKRWQENPNDKEKYFQQLRDLMKSNQIDRNLYTDELKRCFGARIFYSINNNIRKYIAEERY